MFNGRESKVNDLPSSSLWSIGLSGLKIFPCPSNDPLDIPVSCGDKNEIVLGELLSRIISFVSNPNDK